MNTGADTLVDTPAWSPDGKQILVSYDGDIYAYSIESGGLQHLYGLQNRMELHPIWVP